MNAALYAPGFPPKCSPFVRRFQSPKFWGHPHRARSFVRSFAGILRSRTPNSVSSTHCCSEYARSFCPLPTAPSSLLFVRAAPPARPDDLAPLRLPSADLPGVETHKLSIHHPPRRGIPSEVRGSVKNLTKRPVVSSKLLQYLFYNYSENTISNYLSGHLDATC